VSKKVLDDINFMLENPNEGFNRVRSNHVESRVQLFRMVPGLPDQLLDELYWAVHATYWAGYKRALENIKQQIEV
jgi:hypothetical protein